MCSGRSNLESSDKILRWPPLYMIDVMHFKYLLAQDMEQNLLVPLNWLAGAKFLQYSHFSTERNKKKADGKYICTVFHFAFQYSNIPET